MDENGLYDAHAAMVSTVNGEAKKEVFNWHSTLEIPTADLQKVRMVDVSAEAAQWRNAEPAEDMYFTHRQYYGDGLNNIIDELKRKSTSNRALYSLLAQKNISDSGDYPIPSFLTFQCTIEKEILYCTASFRALEVSHFLKVNLEEIRLNLVDICGAFPALEMVRLHIFAFHAYSRPAAVATLRRPKIEVVPEGQLLRLMQLGDVRELEGLLAGLAKSTTVVSPKSLRALLGNLQMPDGGLHANILSKRGLLEPQLQDAIKACNELAESRKAASRGVPGQSKIHDFHAAVKKIQATLLS